MWHLFLTMEYIYFVLLVYFLPFGSPSDEKNEVLGKPYDKNNHLELDCPIPHVFLTDHVLLKYAHLLRCWNFKLT